MNNECTECCQGDESFESDQSNECFGQSGLIWSY